MPRTPWGQSITSSWATSSWSLTAGECNPTWNDPASMNWFHPQPGYLIQLVNESLSWCTVSSDYATLNDNPVTRNRDSGLVPHSGLQLEPQVAHRGRSEWQWSDDILRSQSLRTVLLHLVPSVPITTLSIQTKTLRLPGPGLESHLRDPGPSLMP